MQAFLARSLVFGLFLYSQNSEEEALLISGWLFSNLNWLLLLHRCNIRKIRPKIRFVQSFPNQSSSNLTEMNNYPFSQYDTNLSILCYQLFVLPMKMNKWSTNIKLYAIESHMDKYLGRVQQTFKLPVEFCLWPSYLWYRINRFEEIEYMKK